MKHLMQNIIHYYLNRLKLRTLIVLLCISRHQYQEQRLHLNTDVPPIIALMVIILSLTALTYGSILMCLAPPEHVPTDLMGIELTPDNPRPHIDQRLPPIPRWRLDPQRRTHCTTRETNRPSRNIHGFFPAQVTDEDTGIPQINTTNRI